MEDNTMILTTLNAAWASKGTIVDLFLPKSPAWRKQAMTKNKNSLQLPFEKFFRLKPKRHILSSFFWNYIGNCHTNGAANK
ncbi:hypothetical protein MA16_Dca018146 [Dendrobium catenatum]|uniref:Uncharacterized protein n=1 Tax=Dendrobium catenatum TaxID=906689 RepID=A0A2I0VSQ6_9ASPA|nr:hypothetical protein MA16_Dca018146 [Dendrobium catenatum]